MSKNQNPFADSPDTWSPEVAFLMANMADVVSRRLEAVIVLLEHLEEQPVDEPSGGWTLATAIDLVKGCQSDLRQPETKAGQL